MSNYETVPGTGTTVKIGFREWIVSSLRIYPMCEEVGVSCGSQRYIVTGETVEESRSGWKIGQTDLPCEVGREGWHTAASTLEKLDFDFEPCIEKHCEVCDV